jgi:hypothetical protein
VGLNFEEFSNFATTDYSKRPFDLQTCSCRRECRNGIQRKKEARKEKRLPEDKAEGWKSSTKAHQLNRHQFSLKSNSHQSTIFEPRSTISIQPILTSFILAYIQVRIAAQGVACVPHHQHRITTRG